MLEHFGFPCDIEEDKPLMTCPNCGEEIFDRDEPFFSELSGKLMGCENCITQRTIYKEDYL